MKCEKCKIEFEEDELDTSHDIPKYIGGTDADGRHYLCKICHREYDETIVIRCLKYLGEEYDGDLIGWQKELEALSDVLKERLREIAHQIKEEWFNG